MPGTSTVAATGSQDINGLLSGVKWATSTLTFSFPQSASAYDYSQNGEVNTFGILSASAQTAARGILDMYESVANVTFTELTDGQSGQGDLRFADTDAISTAWAYYPHESSAGGDLWFHKSGEYGANYDTPGKGDYGYFTYIHETGHALGLKHGHDTGIYGALPSNHDSLEYSVMTYRSYVGAATGSGYTNEYDGFPQTLMQDDIAALQYMYGANFNYKSGDTVYTWSPFTGEMFVDGTGQGAPSANRIFMTIWDGGGIDTYDFAGYADGLSVYLVPGWGSSTGSAQRADLGDGHVAGASIYNALLYQGDTRSLIENALGGSGNDSIIGNAADNMLRGRDGIDYLSGGDGNDTLIGDAGNDGFHGGIGNDVMTGGTGDDTLEGAEGTDTAVFSGDLLDYSIYIYDDGFRAEDLRGPGFDGMDTLRRVETLQFADRTATSWGHEGTGYMTWAAGSAWKMFLDPLSAQNWSHYLEAYNAGGSRLSQNGTYDTGAQWKNFWDANSEQIWASYSEFWNAGGVRANQLGTYDTGARWTNHWDANNDQLWSFYSEQFNTAGVQANQIGTYDSGARWSRNWDANDDQLWSYYSEQFNTAGVRANQIGDYDSGARWSNNWDADNGQVWSYYSESFHTNGVKANQLGTYDSGAQWKNYCDAAGDQGWSFYSEHWLDGDSRANQLGTYDNGAQWKNYWDAQSTQAWEFYSEAWNASGQIVNRITTWDDGSQTTDWFL